MAYLIPAVVVLGATVYALGSWASGAAGLALRRAGWAVMTAVLLVPSTFTLALPIVVPPALTLGQLPQRLAR